MEEWMTTQQVCDLLQVHRMTLDRWVKAGHLRVFRTPGGRPRYKRSDVVASFREESQWRPRPN